MARHGRRAAVDGAAVTLSQLTGMSRDALLGLWRQYYKAEPPARLRGPLLELAVGWAIQAEEQGGLSPAAARQPHTARAAPPRGRQSHMGGRRAWQPCDAWAVVWAKRPVSAPHYTLHARECHR